MQRTLIIFDFDGTLADTLPGFLRAFDKAADKFGFKRLDRERHHMLRGLDARKIMAHHDIPLWKTPMIARYMRAELAADIAHLGLFDGVPQALRALTARGVTLAIVSSNSLSNVRRILGVEVLALFSHLECGASLFGKLPKIRKVLAASGTAPAQVLLIGDEIRDADVAAEAGIDFGAVAWGFNDVAALSSRNPVRVFTRTDELADA